MDTEPARTSELFNVHTSEGYSNNSEMDITITCPEAMIQSSGDLEND
jgi:hypothetical protein